MRAVVRGRVKHQPVFVQKLAARVTLRGNNTAFPHARHNALG